MGQSLVKNYIHIVFSTKYRKSQIYPPLESELHSYIAGICNKLECYPVIVGGYTDHIHILCMLSKKIALMKLVENIKSHSSKWIKTKDEQMANFYWQGGYGAFSIGQEGVERVKNYIQKQHEHHKRKNFKEEYIEILHEYSLLFDEQYLWR
jgi:putative transposase